MSNKEKRYGIKALAITGALTLALGGAVGGTIAWLISSTDEVTNTFTYGDIDITLTETDTSVTPGDETDQGDTDNDPNTNTYEMVPGTAIKKDPKITVLADSEPAWLFVKLEKSANFDDFMTYEMEAGWTELEDDVWYRTTKWNAADQQFNVIKDNAVNVKEEITKAQLNALDEGKTYPTLTVSAYAVQYDENIEALDTAAEAWALAQAEK